MSDLNLDGRLVLNITGVQGNTLGPILFRFKNPDKTLEDISGSSFRCQLRQYGTLVHNLTDEELILVESESRLQLKLSSEVTSSLEPGGYDYEIQQLKDDTIVTRIYGTITFNPNLSVWITES